MDAKLIFWPIGALALLTFLVQGLIPVRRFTDAFKGRVRASDFALGESKRVPENTRLANRNYINLLEIPVLFYVISLIIYVSDGLTPLLYGLAWAFVGLRYLHSLVHVTFNHVFVRLGLFMTSSVILITIWALVFYGFL